MDGTQPSQVGVRELRDNLRAILDRVASGEEIVITERGAPVARLSTYESKLQQLVAQGKARPPLAQPPKRWPQRIVPKGSVADLIVRK